jgi:hypothetical protein
MGDWQVAYTSLLGEWVLRELGALTFLSRETVGLGRAGGGWHFPEVCVVLGELR